MLGRVPRRPEHLLSPLLFPVWRGSCTPLRVASGSQASQEARGSGAEVGSAAPAKGPRETPQGKLKILGRLSRTRKSQEARVDEVVGSALLYRGPLFEILPVASGSVPRYIQVVSPSSLTRSRSPQ